MKAVVAMLHMHHVGAQVDAKVCHVIKIEPQVALCNKDGGPVEAAE